MKVLVTGGAGYIGSHTVVELLKKNFSVVIADNLCNSSLMVLDGIQKITGKKPDFEQIDLCDITAVNKCLQKHRDISSVIHFAAHKAVGESVLDPLKYYHNNLLSLIHLLEAIAGNSIPIKGFVFSSSCTVYGNPTELPVSEKAEIQPATSPYGNTKRICEEILQDVVKKSDFKAISLRYFNPVGAHDSCCIGELPNGAPNNLVPIITQTAIGKRKQQLEIYGDDYNTHDGTCIRDYIHVTDLAKAHVNSIERLLKGEAQFQYENFNVGTGSGYSVLEIVNLFEKISGVKLNYKVVERRKGDIESMFADISNSKSVLGWKAEKNLDEMIASAWNWEKKIAEKKN